MEEQNGELKVKLPPGFRFHPTDEELVVQYLGRKVHSCPLPASIIAEIDLAKHDPWDLPGGCEHEKYFFAVREAKYPNGSRTNRATRCGYWKATGKDRAIAAAKYNQVVGMKKTLVFYRGKAPNGSRTDWIMHEYRLAAAATADRRKNSSTKTTGQDWVLCRIFKKKRTAKTEFADDMEEDRQQQEEEEEELPRLIDFLGQRRGARPSSPAGSDSSCVTEASDDTSSTTP